MTLNNFGFDLSGLAANLPASPDVGVTYLCTDTGQRLQWDGTKWLGLGGSVTFSFSGANTATQATGTYSTSAVIPANSVIVGGFYDIPTSFAPSTSTLSIQAVSAGDLAATGTASSYASGIHSMIPAYTGGSSIKVGTLPVTVKVVVAAHALTAGTINGKIEYFASTAT